MCNPNTRLIILTAVFFKKYNPGVMGENRRSGEFFWEVFTKEIPVDLGSRDRKRDEQRIRDVKTHILYGE